MNLVLVAAFLAVCGTDKLDRTYLPPASATSAGGSPGSLQTPFKTFNQGLGGLPKGSYSNEFEGVVVDAAASGTRASGADETGLGGPRISYGSTDSKVGEAAFTADTAFPRVGINSGLNTQGAFGGPNNLPQNLESRPERIQASRDRVSNTVKYDNEVSPEGFNYAFETDNGIIAEENGIEVNGVKAQGGYSYTGDDGQVYSVRYTADEEGYRPKGDHLPTPPPIPVEILESLQKNAQDEAAGIVDDGSYDAQKYNTGEEYTKSNNGQYNGGQLVQLGNKPQADAVASGSFISQNNQGFIRPSVQELNSTYLDSSKNIPSNGNTFGVAGSGISSTQNVQPFGFASKNEYLPPNNGFNQNRRPALNGIQGIQNNVQNRFPSSSSTSSSNSGFTNNQNPEIPAFIPLAQQKLQVDKPKRPQSNSPIFGKPTVIDSTLSIKDPFAKRPSSNRFTQTKQPNQKPQPIGGSFEVVSGNVYSSKNEYLPPRRQSHKPNQNNRNGHFQASDSGTQANQQFTHSQLFKPNSPSVSAFAMASRPSSGFQSSHQYYSQQIPQQTANNLFNQMSQNPLDQDQSSLSTSPQNIPGLNKSPVPHFQYKPSTFASQTPTLKPQSELTTPFERNFDQSKDTSPIPVIDGPNPSSQTISSGFPSIGSQSSNSFAGQYSFNSNKVQQASPTQASASIVSTLNEKSVTPGLPNVPELGKPTNNFGSQSQFSNKSPANGQYSFSTQRPNFNQYSQQQGSDDSYYYNTPSKPFNTPTPRPQSSIFPSSSIDPSFKVPQTTFGVGPQLSDPSATAFTLQSNTPENANRYPKPSTLGPIFPTLATQQDGPNGNIFQSQFNKVTQASTSPFPSPTPTTSADFHLNQFDQPQPQQQYGGEIYEYKKPPQTLPSSQNGDTSGQFGQTSQFGSSPSNPHISQSPVVGSYKPGSSFGSKVTQQSFGQRPQSSQDSRQNQPFDAIRPVQTQQHSGQFSSQPSNPSQTFKPIQGAAKFPPAYNKQGPPCCEEVSSPSQSNPADGHHGTPQLSGQIKPNQEFNVQGSDQETRPDESVSTFTGIGESFGGPRKPPSFDKTGYHY